MRHLRLRVPARFGRVLVVLGVVLALGLFGPARATHAAPNQCFPQTGYCISGVFLTYWQTHGALPIYGYPISDVHNEIDPQTGNVYQVQWFERNRFEEHPENAGTPYEVLLGLLGNQVTAGRQNEPPFQPIPFFSDTPTRRYFSATGHSLAYGFKAYWDSHGGLAQFGYPTSEEFVETTAQGSFTVQYFERARFEYHPEAPPAYRVLLGLLGDQLQGTLPGTTRITVTSQVQDVRSVTVEHGNAYMPALLGSGQTTGVQVKITFPFNVSGQSFKVAILNTATTMWSMDTTSPASGNTYTFDLFGKNFSGSYVLVGVTRGVDNPLIWFGIQFAESTATVVPPPFENRDEAGKLVIAYYNAINRQEYDRAYAAWETAGTSATSIPPDFNDFKAGYANTTHDDVFIGAYTGNGAAGSIYYAVPFALIASHTSGPQTRFYGCYLVRRGNVQTGDSLPPYPLHFVNAKAFAGSSGESVSALLSQATTLVNNTECAPV